MKAARIHEYGGPETLTYDDVPDPAPAPGQLLIRVAAAGVNPMDFKIRSGAFQAAMPLPMPWTFGADVAGVVEAVGENVTGFAVGERVAAMSLAQGGYAERVAVDAASAVKIPQGVSDELAAAIPMVGLTAQHGITKHLKAKPGDTILVSGALGSIGRLLVQMLKNDGYEVVAGVRGAKLDDAKALGASRVVALDDPAALDELTPFDAIMDVVGGEVAQGLVSRVKQGGVFVAINPPPPQAPEDGNVDIQLVRVEVDAPTLSKLLSGLASGMISLPQPRKLPLSRAAEAHRLAETGGSTGKVVLVP